jgi:uncharacterized protein YecT (DUF1311 family)
MKIIATAVCACVPLVALCAEPREDVVAAMVRATHMSRADILGSLKRCDGTTADMKTCASYSFTAEDIRLNQIYSTVLKISDAKGARKSLVESQRAWIKYRDLACVFDGKVGAGGGTMEGLYVLRCKELLTKQRADHLQDIANQNDRR